MKDAATVMIVNLALLAMASLPFSSRPRGSETMTGMSRGPSTVEHGTLGREVSGTKPSRTAGLILLLLALPTAIFARFAGDPHSGHPVPGTPASPPGRGRVPWGETGWRRATFVAFGLYLAAQVLPPFQGRPGDLGINRAPGIMMTCLSFVGLVFDGSPLGGRTPGLDQHQLLTLKTTCLMGATANVLIVVGSVSTWIRTYRFGFRAASTATLLAVLVLFPTGVWRDLFMLHVGYLCWAGSAGLLAYASWKLSSPQKSQTPQREL